MPKISGYKKQNKTIKYLVQTIFIFNVRESSETKDFTNKAFHRDLTLVLVSIYILKMHRQQFA